MKTKIVLLFLLIFSICSAQLNEKEVITSFKQGAAGNCASISVIKLAIATYGVDNVFSSVKHENNNYHIIMRDNSVVDLSDLELEMIKDKDYFVKLDNEDVYNYAKFLYAAMAKHKQNMLKLKSIKKAVRHRFSNLLSMDTEDNLKYLGLSNLYELVKLEEIDKHSKIIITSLKHSAFSSNGFYDEYGSYTLNSYFASLHNKKPINDNNYILKH